jgi:hypothetical protein
MRRYQRPLRATPLWNAGIQTDCEVYHSRFKHWWVTCDEKAIDPGVEEAPLDGAFWR